MIRLRALPLAACLAAVAGAAGAATTTMTVAPTSYTTEQGGDGGQPAAQLAAQDQAGTDDDPSKYVSFTTPEASYRGVGSFTLPDEAPAGAISEMTLHVSYRGPAKKTQAWKWKIFDFTKGKFTKLGNNKLASADVWSTFDFAVKGKKKGGGVSRFVEPTTHEVRIQLLSSNDAADVRIDQEALVLKVRTPPTLGACTLFPADHYWNTPVDTLPVDAHSDDYVSALGPGTHFHPDFGSGTYGGGPIGIPWTSVDASQPLVDVSFYYDDSDPGPYPIPPDAPIEGGPQSHGDRHVLVVDSDACKLYEMYDSHPHADGSWDGGSGAVFDLGSNALRPDGWTSADAAGFAILPGLVRYEEVQAGEIKHAIRFTASDIRDSYVWPATHHATCGGHGANDMSVPPMGQRFRLKASFDVSGFAPEMQVILNAMKVYGIVLADCGSNWFVSGVPDERWDNDTLVGEFDDVHGSDFEAVDTSGMQVSPDSAQAQIP